MANIAQARPSAYAAKSNRRFWGPRGRRASRTMAFYAMISPWLIGFLLLGVIPLVVGLLASFTNYDGLNVNAFKWIGTRNYSRVFQDSEAIYAFRRTLLWSALNVPIWLALSFTLALILNQSIRARGFFRTLFYLPSIIPAVGAVWAWRLLLDPNNGVVNAIISIFRPGTAILWTTDYALQSLTMIAVWQGAGVGMVIFLAGLQGIPRELEEAAFLDGASTLQSFRFITIPLMTPVIFFQLVLAIIGSLQQFALPMLLAGGRMGSVPPRDAYFFVVHVMRQIFTFSRFGYGLALLWLLFIIVVVLTIVVFWSSRYWVHYEVEIAGDKK
ncbi:MAG: sugar ABC transporter permease [Caldilineaceae bacterium]|nr:sugar ABC transporter permease [Caldilineaceae bacterium]